MARKKIGVGVRVVRVVGDSGCGHVLVSILSRGSIRRLGGGRVSWCRVCGALRHVDVDGSVRWVSPSYVRTW